MASISCRAAGASGSGALSSAVGPRSASRRSGTCRDVAVREVERDTRRTTAAVEAADAGPGTVRMSASQRSTLRTGRRQARRRRSRRVRAMLRRLGVVMTGAAVKLAGGKHAPGPLEQLDGAVGPPGGDRRSGGVRRQVPDRTRFRTPGRRGRAGRAARRGAGLPPPRCRQAPAAVCARRWAPSQRPGGRRRSAAWREPAAGGRRRTWPATTRPPAGPPWRRHRPRRRTERAPTAPSRAGRGSSRSQGDPAPSRRRPARASRSASAAADGSWLASHWSSSSELSAPVRLGRSAWPTGVAASASLGVLDRLVEKDPVYLNRW